MIVQFQPVQINYSYLSQKQNNLNFNGKIINGIRTRLEQKVSKINSSNLLENTNPTQVEFINYFLDGNSVKMTDSMISIFKQLVPYPNIYMEKMDYNCCLPKSNELLKDIYKFHKNEAFNNSETNFLSETQVYCLSADAGLSRITVHIKSNPDGGYFISMSPTTNSTERVKKNWKDHFTSEYIDTNQIRKQIK